MGYRKPTLVETYTELHLLPETLTEARFFDVVPKLKDAGFTEIEFATAGLRVDVRPGASPRPRETQRVRCWKPGRRELAQVAEDWFAVNLTGEYPGWDAFVQLFNEGRRALQDGLGGLEIRSLALLTLDRFTVAKEGFSVSQYLDVGGRVVPAWYADCSESLDLDIGRGLLEPDGRNRQIHVKVQAATDPVTISFRVEFHDRVQEGVDLLDMLARLHDESNDTFEALITDRVRSEVMGGRVA